MVHPLIQSVWFLLWFCFSLERKLAKQIQAATSSFGSRSITILAINSINDGVAEANNREIESMCDLHSPLRLLYQDSNLLLIEKPFGVPHHNEFANNNNLVDMESKLELPGIITLLRYQIDQGLLPDVTDQSLDPDATKSLPNNTTESTTTRIYGVHRLDKVTSGILILAKNTETAKVLGQAFRNHQIVKFYCGLSFQKSKKKKKQGLIQGFLYRGRRKSWMLSTEKNRNSTNNCCGRDVVVKTAAGLSCKTRFYTAGLGHLKPNFKNIRNGVTESPKTLLWFRPYTGRTHQLRVSAKSVGLPLAGDPIYATSSNQKVATSGPSFPRTCLHATALHIPHSIMKALPQQKDKNNDKKIVGNFFRTATIGTKNDTGITIWSTPPFGVYYDNYDDNRHYHKRETVNETMMASFNSSLYGLIQKHCMDFPALQQLARRALIEI